MSTLSEQIEAARKQLESWPDWMRKAARWEGSDASGLGKTAARISSGEGRTTPEYSEHEDMTKLIYLASPYSDPDWRIERKRFFEVCSAAARMVQQGIRIYSPIAHTHPIAERADIEGIALPGGYEFWREVDERMISACDELWVLKLDGWAKSDGVRREVEYARSIGKPVSLVTEPDHRDAISYEAFLVRQVSGQ